MDHLRRALTSSSVHSHEMLTASSDHLFFGKMESIHKNTFPSLWEKVGEKWRGKCCFLPPDAQ